MEKRKKGARIFYAIGTSHGVSRETKDVAILDLPPHPTLNHKEGIARDKKSRQTVHALNLCCSPEAGHYLYYRIKSSPTLILYSNTLLTLLILYLLY